MPATDLITPEVHDPLAIRRAGPEVLGLALMDARTRTLAWLSAFDGHSLPSTHAEFDAPLWLAGHVAWFQEWWIARNVQRSRGAGCDPRGPRLPSLDRRADAWFDPRTCPRAWRWSASGQDLPARREYLAATLESTLELLDKTPSSPDGLHFFRLALHREDEVCEQLAVLAQALDLPAGRYPDFWPAPPTRVLREAIWLPSQRVQLGRGGLGDSLASDAWRPAIEDGRLEESLPEFEIDAQLVCWAQWAEFVEDGGYDRQDCWSEAGWQWLQAEGRRAPRYVEQQTGGVMARAQGRLQKMPAARPALHLAWHEAQAWCRWAGRRLPCEAEWALARHAASSRGFAWGDALEWVADRAALWPGHRPAPGEAVDAPLPGQRVLRGASFAAGPRLRHPAARRFALPTDDAAFCGFRSCAL